MDTAKGGKRMHVEVYAVLHGLRFCEHRGERQFGICKDSLNFLTALQNPGAMDPLLQQIVALLHVMRYKTSVHLLLSLVFESCRY